MHSGEMVFCRTWCQMVADRFGVILRWVPYLGLGIRVLGLLESGGGRTFWVVILKWVTYLGLEIGVKEGCWLPEECGFHWRKTWFRYSVTSVQRNRIAFFITARTAFLAIIIRPRIEKNGNSFGTAHRPSRPHKTTKIKVAQLLRITPRGFFRFTITILENNDGIQRYSTKCIQLVYG